MLVSVLFTPALVHAQEKPNPGDATWHLGLSGLLPAGEEGGDGPGLDIYPVFEGGRWVRAVATSREFNTSMHFVEPDVTLNGDSLKGTLKIMMTPDRWVPKDGRLIEGEVAIDATLNDQGQLSGTYKGTLGGEPVEGKVHGGAGATESGWESASWSFDANPVVQQGMPDRPMIRVNLRVDGDKIISGSVAPLWRKSPPRVIDIDTSGLKLEGATVTGSFTAPQQVLDIAAPPGETTDVELKVHRVQGLVGGQMTIAELGSAKDIFAAGRGTAGKRSPAGNDAGGDANPPLWVGSIGDEPWFIPTKDYEAPEPGEHPRLLFRKADVPALREKAKTEEGQQIVKRLRFLLDGDDGEDMPSHFNTTAPHNHSKSGDQPIGKTFTSFHAPGYAMLYQLTGDKKYAQMSRKSIELMWAGTMDRDNRYGWETPGTTFRAGPVLSSVALAYDLAYDAWPEDFRQRVAQSIANYAQQEHESGGGQVVTLERLAGRTGYPPGSNHYGAYMGGGVAALAILDDPGVDSDMLRQRISEFERMLVQQLHHGFGDHGWYSEGDHPSRISANLGTLPFAVALKNVAGRDYINGPRTNLDWITLRWIYHLVPRGNGAMFPHRGTYGDDRFVERGEFAYGWHAIPDRYRPALLWTWQNGPKDLHDNWGAAVVPVHAVWALAGWLTDVEPVNPGELLPKAYADTVHGYFVARNRWQDGDDILVTHLLHLGDEGYHEVKDAGRILIYGLGTSTAIATKMREQQVTHYAPGEDGSYTLTTRGGDEVNALAVDMSGASGRPLLIVGTGNAFKGIKEPTVGGKEVTTAFKTFTVDGRDWFIFTMHKGEAQPLELAPPVDGNLTVGGQTLRFDGDKLVLDKFKPASNDPE